MKGPVVAMTSGVFETLHGGHIRLLWRTRQLGDLLVVGVVSDSGVLAYKGHRPIEPAEVRMRNVAAIPWVDTVCLQETTDPSPLLERFRPDVFSHGDDWQRLIAGNETIERLGIRFVLLPYTPGVSSTMLRLQLSANGA